jgi:hypothetical protein
MNVKCCYSLHLKSCKNQYVEMSLTVGAFEVTKGTVICI